MHFKKYWLVIPFAVALVLHIPVLFSGFVWDDTALVQTNTALGETSVSELYLQDYGQHLACRAPVGYYRPTFVAALSMVYRAAGPSPLVFHSFALLLFCAAAVLSAMAADAVMQGRSKTAACLAGCLYASHPARTELAGFVMSMPDLIVEMCAALILLVSSLAWTGRRRGIAVFLLVAASALAAVTSKESSYFVLAGMAGAGCVSAVWHRNLAGRAALTAAGVVTAIAAGLLLSSQAGISRAEPAQYLASVFGAGSAGSLKALAYAARDMLVPGHTVFMASVDSSSSAASVAGVVLAVSVMGLAAAAAARRSLTAGLAAGWCAGGLFSLMTLGAVGVPYAQRYIPAAPLLIGLAALAYRWIKPALRRTSLYIALLLIAVNGAYALAGSFKFRDNLVFFTFMADEQPDLVYPRKYLVDRLFYEYRNYGLMEKRALEGIALAGDGADAAFFYGFLAKKRIIEGNMESAMDMIFKADAVLGAETAQSLYLKAVCLLNLGNAADAQSLLDRAVSLEPDNLEYTGLRDRIGK